MATLNLKIRTENSAFQQSRSAELVRILREVADRIEVRGSTSGMDYKVLDYNGNGVGRCWQTGR